MILTSKLFTLGLAVFLSPIPHIWADSAILVALPSERDAVRREIRLVGQSVDLAGHRVSIGYRKGEKLYIVKTGAGNLNSAMVMEGLIAKYKVDRVISIGVAGNLNEQWREGDVLCVTNIISHQSGKETPGGFETKEPSAISHQLSAEYVRKCEELRSNAVEMAKLAADAHGSNTNLRVFAALREGKLVSGDSFIASTAKRAWLRETFRADAVDMVSAGIAHVCEANGVPYIILRVLSDNADETASADFAAFVQKNKEPITAEIAVKIVDEIAAGKNGAVAPLRPSSEQGSRDPPRTR
jgi:5'-methylthioadenosine/S-adenosylhomocysteine nucleosidase